MIPPIAPPNNAIAGLTFSFTGLESVKRHVSAEMKVSNGGKSSAHRKISRWNRVFDAPQIGHFLPL
jgi:hypothetical protein